MHPLDTSPGSRARQVEALRRLTPEQRLAEAALGSDRQLRDVAAMLDIGGQGLDLAYVDRWIDALGLRAPWDQAQAMRATD